MTKEEFFSECQKDRYLKAMYVFRDAKGEMVYARAYLCANGAVKITAEASGEEVGYINVHPHPNKRAFLGEVYTYTKFRGRKIASRMDEIAEHFLARNGYDGFLLRGVFEPTQMGYDRQNNVYCSPEELEARAKAFYNSRGYQIVSVEDFEAHPEKYPNLTMFDDFELGEGTTWQIVAKTIHKQKMPEDVVDFVSVDGKERTLKTDNFIK